MKNSRHPSSYLMWVVLAGFLLAAGALLQPGIRAAGPASLSSSPPRGLSYEKLRKHSYFGAVFRSAPIAKIFSKFWPLSLRDSKPDLKKA